MKNLLLIILTFCTSATLLAQSGTTITYTDNFGDVLLTYNGLVNTKHSYQGSADGATITISWSGTLWEIYINVGSEDLSFTSATPTTSNPPNFSIGNWQDVAADGTDLVGLSGTGATSTALPIKLAEFDAKAIKSSISLNWKTASEENNAGFEIQRSVDGKTFETLTFLEGKGTTHEGQEYDFVDKGLNHNKVYYYRLKQVDYDGRFEYSKIISARMESKESSVGNIYPNPTINGYTKLEYSSDVSTELTVTVYNMAGQLMATEIHQIISGVNNLNFDFSTIPRGSYFVNLDAGNNKRHQKLIIE